MSSFDLFMLNFIEVVFFGAIDWFVVCFCILIYRLVRRILKDGII